MTEDFITIDGYINIRGNHRDRAKMYLHTDDLEFVEDEEIEELFYDLNNPYWIMGDKDDKHYPRKHFTVITMDTPIYEHTLRQLLDDYDLTSIEPGPKKLLRYRFSRK